MKYLKLISIPLLLVGFIIGVVFIVLQSSSPRNRYEVKDYQNSERITIIEQAGGNGYPLMQIVKVDDMEYFVVIGTGITQLNSFKQQ